MDINALRQRVAAMQELSQATIAEHDEHYWFDFTEFGASPEEVEPTLDGARNLLSRLQRLVEEVPRVQDEAERALADAERRRDAAIEAAEAMHTEFDSLNDDAQAIDSGVTERDTLENTIEELEQRIQQLRAGGEKGRALAIWELPRKEKRKMARTEAKGLFGDAFDKIMRARHTVSDYAGEAPLGVADRLREAVALIDQALIDWNNDEELGKSAEGKGAKGDGKSWPGSPEIVGAFARDPVDADEAERMWDEFVRWASAYEGDDLDFYVEASRDDFDLLVPMGRGHIERGLAGYREYIQDNYPPRKSARRPAAKARPTSAHRLYA